MNANRPAWQARAGATGWEDNVTSIQRPNGYAKHDAGTHGIEHEVNALSEVEAFYQFEDLRAATPEMQAAARVRMAALRRRLLGDGRAA